MCWLFLDKKKLDLSHKIADKFIGKLIELNMIVFQNLLKGLSKVTLVCKVLELGGLV